MPKFWRNALKSEPYFQLEGLKTHFVPNLSISHHQEPLLSHEKRTCGELEFRVEIYEKITKPSLFRFFVFSDETGQLSLLILQHFRSSRNPNSEGPLEVILKQARNLND